MRGFLRWLKKQKDRDDMVGDLAKDFIADNCPVNFDLNYLRGNNACKGAIEAFNEAVDEYGQESKF